MFMVLSAIHLPGTATMQCVCYCYLNKKSRKCHSCTELQWDDHGIPACQGKSFKDTGEATIRSPGIALSNESQRQTLGLRGTPLC
ncbi:hypothetical protein OIU84_002786 [Salix udensis]|uniref:Uncharacterized protein n=1 Tax=Salix udensis TaxID=889485 RepID=A0AAD6P546_9ROSI|nr:hypothetical protein OIU84_002786 [Salix udensis]